MSVTYGFYNALNGDRKYNASQFSSLFDGVINDGVFMSIGGHFNVEATTGMNITVDTGRAWFDSTWLDNDAKISLTIDPSEVVLNRIDTVVIEIDSSIPVRANTIKIIKGTPATEAVAPTLIRTVEKNQYPLCHISVLKNSTSLTQANITNKIGTSDCPFITGILETVNIDNLIAQWGTQWSQWLTATQTSTDAWILKEQTDFNNWQTQGTTDFNSWKTLEKNNFDLWFSTIQTILDENTAGNLLNLINGLRTDLDGHISSSNKNPHGTTGSDISLTGYTKPTTYTAISPTDKVNDALGKIERLAGDKPSLKTFTATISTSWNGSSAPYTQTIAVDGMLSTMVPISDVVLSSDKATAIAQKEAWCLVDDLVTANGSIILTCLEDKPTVQIPIQMIVIF